MDAKTKKDHKKKAEAFRKTKITGDFPESDFNREFGTVEKCIAVLEKIRWNGKPYSPFTKSYNVKRITTKPEKIRHEYQRYQWLDRTCNRHFSVLTGTPFANSKVPLTKWFKMLWYICVTSNSISSYMYAALLDVSQTTAWFMHQRIMACLEQDEGAIFKGVVEMDEMFYGGSDKWRPDSRKSCMLEKGDGKQPVVGMVERGSGRIMLKPVPDVTAASLLPHAIAHTTPDTVVYTDDNTAYAALGNLCIHDSVCHSAGEFVKGEVHTQSIDSHWARLRKNLRDSYMSVTRHHLQRYLNEFVFFSLTRYMPHRMRFQVALLLMNKSVQWKDIVMPGRESYAPGERLKGKKRGRAKELHYVRKTAPPGAESMMDRNKEPLNDTSHERTD